MLQLPEGKMEKKNTSIKDDYRHLFTTTIDSIFAMLPVVFLEVRA
jgi:hypothetical protein